MEDKPAEEIGNEFPSLDQLLTDAQSQRNQHSYYSQLSLLRSPQPSVRQSPQQLTQQLLQQLSDSQQLSQQLLDPQQLSEQLSQQLSEQLSQRSSPQPPPSQAARGLITFKQFLADLEHCKSSSLDYTAPTADYGRYQNYMIETGQQNDSPTLIMAREMALATVGIYASCTARMAFDCHFGDEDAYYAALHKQREVRKAAETQSCSTMVNTTTEEEAGRPTRAAAQRASSAWAELGPRKRQRRN